MGLHARGYCYEGVHLLLAPKERLARALTPSLCTPPLRSHTPLLPSTTAISSSATFCANPPLPLPLLRRLLAASRIHCTACRRRCLEPRGTGICKATPPPAAPFWDRIRRRGATESIASVRYRIGLRGRWDAGGAPGSKGRLGLTAGGEAVRRCVRIIAIFWRHETVQHQNSRLQQPTPAILKAAKGLTHIPSGPHSACHPSSGGL